MKKLLAVLAIATIALTSTFATKDTNNVIVNGYVSESAYSFDLVYSGKTANSENTALNEKLFNLADKTKQSTDTFFLERSNGNLNKDLKVSVDITTDAFVGNVNGNDVTTAIIPKISLQNENKNNYADIVNSANPSQNSTAFNVTVPYGYNSKKNVEIASFKLDITGDETTDAGTYKSNVVINYTYDQN